MNVLKKIPQMLPNLDSFDPEGHDLPAEYVQSLRAFAQAGMHLVVDG